ncbi:MAG: serine hydrolase, partial [Bacteroidota bacterium]
YIEQARIDWGVPGLAVAIVKDGKVWISQGFGVQKEGSSTRVDENTLFAIASNTKAFISSALAVLVDEGKVLWDDPVIKYLPYFKLYDPYVTQSTTIADLLCHRAGLGTYSGDVIWYKSELSEREVIERIRYVPQAYPFRAGYGYSNLMFITAGEVIRAVTGQAWDEFVADRFFVPLGMNRTVTSTTRLPSSNVATPHKPVDDANQPIAWTQWDNMGAAGGIISSVRDMSQWLQMNLSSGLWEGDTLLDPKQQNVLWTPHNSFVISATSHERFPGRNFNGYGLGWGLYDYHGRKVATHSGGYDGMYSRVAMVPEEQLGIVILTNSMSGVTLPLTLWIMNQFLKADLRDWSKERLESNSSGGESRISVLKRAKVEGTMPSAELSSYEGSYDAPMHGDIKVIQDGNDLQLTFSKAPLLSATLRHWHHDTWEIVWDETHAWFDFGLITFQLDNQRQVRGLEFEVPNYDIFFDELEVVKKE